MSRRSQLNGQGTGYHWKGLIRNSYWMRAIKPVQNKWCVRCQLWKCDWEMFTSYNCLTRQLAASRKGTNTFSRNLQQVNTRLRKKKSFIWFIFLLHNFFTGNWIGHDEFPKFLPWLSRLVQTIVIATRSQQLKRRNSVIISARNWTFLCWNLLFLSGIKQAMQQ